MDKKDMKFLSCSYNICIIILFLLTLTEFFSIFWMIHISEWVYTSMGANSLQNPDMLNFDGRIFKGSLFGCNTGCEGSYKLNMKDWCSYAKMSQKIPSKSLCESFISLFYSSLLFTAFQYCSVFLLFLQFFCIVSLKKSGKYAKIFKFSAVYKVVFIFLANIMWTLINDVSFHESCSQFPQNGHNIILCLSLGPKISYCLAGTSLVFHLIYRRILNRLKKMKGPKDKIPDRPVARVNYNGLTVDASRRESTERIIQFESQQEIKDVNTKKYFDQPVSFETVGIQRMNSTESLESLNEESK